MGSQIITLAALERQYETDGAEFKQKAIDVLLPSAVLGTALAARGEPPFRYPQRWACNAAFKVAGWLNSKTEVSVLFTVAEQLGLKPGDIAQAERIMQQARRAREATEDDALRLAEELVSKRVKADPDYRRRSMQRIYGLMDASAEPVAVVAALNGHANGNGAH